MRLRKDVVFLLLACTSLVLGDESVARIVTASEKAGVKDVVPVSVDGKLHHLEIMGHQTQQEAALAFCQRHNLLPQHCNELVAHIRSLGKARAPEPAQSTAEDEDQAEGGGTQTRERDQNQDPDQDSNPESDQDQDRKQLQGAEETENQKIDYSERVGPSLAVTLAGGKRDALQCYRGEGISRAVQRFCKKHRMGPADCDVVDDSFRRLHAGERGNLNAPSRSGQTKASGTSGMDGTSGNEDESAASFLGQDMGSEFWTSVYAVSYKLVVLVLFGVVTMWMQQDQDRDPENAQAPAQPRAQARGDANAGRDDDHED